MKDQPIAKSSLSDDLRNNDPNWHRLAPYLLDSDDIDLLYYLYEGMIFPKEKNLMLRCRMTGGELTAEQLTALAEISETHGGSYADITTRANLQIRDIPDAKGLTVLRKLLDLNIAPAVKGLNNLRNVTVTPTTGFDSEELIDVMPIAKDILDKLLYQKELQGIPGKLNIALDSGGQISIASEANDLGIKAVLVNHTIYFRFSVADIKNEKTISQDLNWLIKPSEVISITSAIIHTYLKEGDFTQRFKSRLKFLIAQIGIETFKTKVKSNLTEKTTILQSPSQHQTNQRPKDAHIGVHDQAQNKLCYLGITGAAGRYTSSQLRTLASISEKYGNSSIRLTTLQNCLIPSIDKSNINQILTLLEKNSLSAKSKIASNIVACTGSSGCSYSATDTKAHSIILSQYLQESGDINNPINIHFTGCSFSCAQNYIGDIGLIGTKVKGQECYHVYLGGGADANIAAIRVKKALPHQELAPYIKSLLDSFKQEKKCGENFNNYVRRTSSSHFTELEKKEVC